MWFLNIDPPEQPGLSIVTSTWIDLIICPPAALQSPVPSSCSAALTISRKKESRPLLWGRPALTPGGCTTYPLLTE